MRHEGGCGDFFLTTEPVCFHEEMACKTFNLEPEITAAVLQRYARWCLDHWRPEILRSTGDEIATLIQAIEELAADHTRPGADLVHRLSADLVDLSRLMAAGTWAKRRWLREKSKSYGLGQGSAGFAERIRKALGRVTKQR